MKTQDEIDKIVKEFIRMNTVEADYLEFCNYLREQDPDIRITFYPAFSRTFIDMYWWTSFRCKNFQKKLSDKKIESVNYLIKNLS